MAVEFDCIEVEQIGNVRRITLARPERRNALNARLVRELVHAVTRAGKDPATNVVILRGAGPAFCAGYDLGGGDEGVTEVLDNHPVSEGHESAHIHHDLQNLLANNDNWRRIRRSPVPILAQLHGYCLAGGTDLAFSCDLVIAAEDARIGFPPVRSMGVPPTHLWIYHVGPQWAKRLLLSGDLITGKRAAEIGLVVESVPAATLDEHVLHLATRMAHIPRELLAGNKAVVDFGMDLMGRDTLQDLAALQDAIGHVAPGVEAFYERIARFGLRAAIEERDAPFAQGNLIE